MITAYQNHRWVIFQGVDYGTTILGGITICYDFVAIF